MKTSVFEGVANEYFLISILLFMLIISFHSLFTHRYIFFIDSTFFFLINEKQLYCNCIYDLFVFKSMNTIVL